MLARYLAGQSQGQIAKEFDICQSLVSRILRSHPLWAPGGRNVWTPDRRRQACELYNAGMTQKQVAHVLGSSQNRVCRVLQEEGVLARESYSFPSGDNNPSWKGGRKVDDN